MLGRDESVSTSDARNEIEDKGDVVVFHHLHDSGSTGGPEVSVSPAAPQFAQANALGGLRKVSSYEAWELGAIAAIEDERLFGPDD